MHITKRGIGLFCFCTVVLVAVVGCDIFGPQLTIYSFSANTEEVEMGGSLTFTVQGSTNPDDQVNDFVDFTGTVDVLIDGISQDPREIEQSFNERYTISFENAGKFTLKAQLTGANGTVVESTPITITVIEPVASSEGSKSNPVTLTFGGSARNSKVGAGESSYYYFTIGSDAWDFTVDLGAGGMSIVPALYNSTAFDFDSMEYYVSGMYPMENGVWQVDTDSTNFPTLKAGTYYLELQNISDTQDYTFNLRVY